MKEKQIETMFADISDTLHKHIDLEPYQYLSVEYAKKYNNMRVSIDIPSIINELYDMGYRKQIEGVSCKDCKFLCARVIGKTQTRIQTGLFCERIRLWVEPNDFCSYGERK